MTHSECPQQCTAFGGSARRKRSGSTIGSYCRISSARLRVLCSPIVRKTLLEVAKWRHLDLPRCLPRQKRNDSDVVRRCGDATRAGHAQEAGQLVIFVGAGVNWSSIRLAKLRAPYRDHQRRKRTQRRN
jgi:hypothetical protein